MKFRGRGFGGLNVSLKLAGTTGLEPATSAVTGQRSNQLSYVPPSKTGAHSVGTFAQFQQKKEKSFMPMKLLPDQEPRDDYRKGHSVISKQRHRVFLQVVDKPFNG